MDNHRTFPEGPHFPLAKPFQPPPLVTERPAHFVPMELVLVPTGMKINLDGPDQIIGRHSTADVRLALPDVSRRHARLVFCRRGWHLFDLGSLNGTLVNNRRVTESELRHGDRIRIGSFLLEVRLPDASTVFYPVRESRQAS